MFCSPRFCWVGKFPCGKTFIGDNTVCAPHYDIYPVVKAQRSKEVFAMELWFFGGRGEGARVELSLNVK